MLFSSIYSVSHIYITLLRRRGWYTVLALSLLSSVLPSLSNIFRRNFLSNRASQSLQTWYGTSARGPTRRLPNSGPPLIYFLFPCSVHFWTLHLEISGINLVSKKLQISCLKSFFSSTESNQLIVNSDQSALCVLKSEFYTLKVRQYMYSILVLVHEKTLVE